MLCDFCHKNIATVHLTEMDGDKIVELHLCNKCAKAKTNDIKEQLSLGDLLGSLGDLTVDIDSSKKFPKCSFCGLTFQELRKKGRLGCSECYNVFEDYLIPLIKKIHGATHHTGKSPLALDKKVVLDRKIKELKEQLQRAVSLEEYEEAAKLRDEIRELENKLKKDVR